MSPAHYDGRRYFNARTLTSKRYLLKEGVRERIRGVAKGGGLTGFCKPSCCLAV